MDRLSPPLPGRGRDSGGEGSLVRSIDAALAAAADCGASDIHFEPQQGGVRVRVRVDGCLRDLQRLPPGSAAAVASRLKLMARMDIAERRLPQDGRLEIVSPAGERVEARASALPTIHGEKLVLRLLRSSAETPSLDALGLDPENRDILRRALAANSGMVIVTGPTGSGKSTTLYAALGEIDVAGRNVVTAEDPVERRIAGANQVQVNDEIGLTFATALRAFLRQDPDVILVGEIRDRDTAEIAVRAALTGHLVLTTLHANDAAATVARLVDMGVAPFLVAASLRLVVAQRLVRTCCTGCRGAGCTACARTGLRGRTGVFEALTMTEALRRMVSLGAGADELRHAAVTAGMRPLAASAQALIARGMTTTAEILRAVDPS